MIIERAEIYYVDVKAEDNPEWTPIFCRIYTNDGLYGDGEAAITYGDGALGVYGLLQEYTKKIIGMDPLDNEVIWEMLYKETFWAQNGGPYVFAAISAIDVALWDIKGKYFGVPVYKLLGGKMRDKLHCYASQLQFGWDDTLIPAYTTEEYAENARKALAEGYDALKYDFFMFGQSGEMFTHEETTRLQSAARLNMIEDRMRAVRETAGPDVDIIIENHSFTDAQSAVQIGERLKKYGIFCFEEPCTPNPKMNKYVCDRLAIPIAQGERIYTRWQYAPYFETNSIQLIQPDIGNCGGITEVKKICDMAHVYDIGVQIHVCSSPLLTAASLQLEAVIPNFVIHEHHVYNRYDYNRKLCKYDYQPRNGYFSIPDLPGIGNELSEYVLNEYTYKAEIM